MSIRIDLPSAGLLGIPQATVREITGATTLEQNSVYILGGTSAYTVTLPATPNNGATILLKRVGHTNTITVASTNIENEAQTIEITNNQPIWLVYHNATFGWLIA